MLRSLLLIGMFLFAFARVDAATLLPPGEQVFLDNNGQPLASGSVYFYIPSTTTFKNTYQDAAGSILNTNPVVLDSGGRGLIFGSGVYRQIVKDINGNIIWDQLTADTSASNASYAGVSTGTANAQIVNAGSFTTSSGQSITFLAGFTNTGALTLTPVGGSPIPVLKGSTTGPVALTGGEVHAGNIYTVVYDGLSGSFQLTTYTLSGSTTIPIIYGGSATNSSLTLQSTSNGAPSGDSLQFFTGNTLREKIDGVGNIQIDQPIATVTQISSMGIHLNASGGGAFTLEALTPYLIMIDLTGKSPTGSTISHSAKIDIAAYDSAGTYTDGAFLLNPGWSFSDVGHMQSDLDIVGFMDGKGQEGLLAYASGCTITGNPTCGVNVDASFIPVPDALSDYWGPPPLGNGGFAARQVVTGTASGTGSKVRLTVASTAQFTSGMSCYVTGVLGTTEANGIHNTCTVVDATHLLETDTTFVHAFSASSGTVGVMNPTDLGAASHQWNNYWGGQDIYIGTSGFGALLDASAIGYKVFAQNSDNAPYGNGDMIRQYVAGTEVFNLTTNVTGTVLGTRTNTALAFLTNNAIRFSMSAAGGLSVGTLTDPGAGAIYENNATFLIRNATTFTNGSGASSGTLTNAPAAGNPTKWISIDDNGVTRKIPAW